MSYTFLVTDDSSTTRAIIKRTIMLSGVPVGQVLDAGDGLLALEKLRTEKIDLLFLDLNMPNMNGLELITEMRVDSKLARVPICVVSSEATESRQAQLSELGVQGYIKKPFTPEQIRGVIQSILMIAQAA
jgi:two-component system chemotaxis response regulator CheY